MKCFLSLFSLLLLISCTPKYGSVIKAVQDNCEQFVEEANINIKKRDSFFLATINNHPVYSSKYTFIVYGKENKNIIIVIDVNSVFTSEDSVFDKIFSINQKLKKADKEIEDLYIDGKSAFKVRLRNSKEKFQYEIIEITDLKELID